MALNSLELDNGKENENYYSILGLYRGYLGIMEKKMETTIVYWGCSFPEPPSIDSKLL